jgi:hypothetical protein
VAAERALIFLFDDDFSVDANAEYAPQNLVRIMADVAQAVHNMNA